MEIIKTEVIKINEVARLTGLSKASVYRLSKAGELPRQIKIGKRSAGWIASEIQDFIKQRMDVRTGG